MKKLVEYKDNIHSCSKCGLCQAACPIYKLTGNDCTVSRGIFIMLKRYINGDLKMSKKLNRYLDLCLKCGKCSNFCPSGINVVDIITSAKAEYFDTNVLEKVLSFFQRYFIFGFCIKLAGLFVKNKKSKKFDKKVIYFGGCGGELKGNRAVVKILNNCGVEVITPKFNCCGIPFFVRGDRSSYDYYKKSFLNVINRYGINDIVTTCASCEKTLKDYKLDGLNIKNIYEYIKEKDLHLTLKKELSVTFHKPCNLNNFSDIEWVLKNIENLNYIEMAQYDSCCGLNGLSKPLEYETVSKICISKHKNIKQTNAKYALTSCLGCEVALKLFSFGKYKVMDMTEFLGKNTISNHSQQ